MCPLAGADSTRSTDPESVTLRVVDEHNFQAIIDLHVAEHQTSLVAPNVKSLAQAFVTPKAWVRAVYAGDEPIGFVMLLDDDENRRYYLWRFMIDDRHQGRGLGTRALELVHAYVRTRPGGDRIYLSYIPADGGPEAFYRAFGYKDTGRVHDGEREAVLEF